MLNIMNMNYNTHTLANGLRIIHLPSAQPVVYCGYAVGAGTRDEELGREEGMAHFCEHITQRYGATQLDEDTRPFGECGGRPQRLHQ